MYIKLPELDQMADTYVCFGITNSETGLEEIIVSKFSNMLNQISNAKTTGENYLTIYFYETDALNLGNRAIELCNTMGKPDLGKGILAQIKNIEKDRRSIVRKVRCVESGELYQSAFRCAQKEGINYSQLHKHLNRMSGYRKVSGKTYEWV